MENLLVLETENRMLLAHNGDLKDIASKPILISINNIQIINDLDNFVKLLYKEKLLTNDIQKEAAQLKESLENPKNEKDVKTQSKSFFRKVLDSIKDTKTITKDLQDTGTWFIEKYDWLKENIDNLPINEIIYHLKHLLQQDFTNHP